MYVSNKKKGGNPMDGQKKGSLLAVAGVSREFLEGLPPMTTKAAQLLLIPLALKVQYTKDYNDLVLYISKTELVNILGLTKSYLQEGNVNKYVSNILVKELLDLKVHGIQIIDTDNTSLRRGWFELAFTEQAMNRFFQGLSSKYFTIGVDTLAKMKCKHTWNIVKEMFLNFDFSNPKAQAYRRNTFVIKRVLNVDYTTEETQKFDRYHLEQRCLLPVIEDLRTMEQFKIYKTKSENPLEDNYLGKSYVYAYGERYIENYYIGYKINKIKAEKQEEDISELILCDDE
jgi:hypothetical protein